VLSGPPPLGPGAPPLDRLIAYGRARVGFLLRNREIARNSLDGSQPIPAGSSSPLSRLHIRTLLGQLDLGPADLDVLAMQLTAALDAPLLLYVSTDTEPAALDRVAQGWEALIRRVARQDD
jgi:polyketide synthase 12